jgi:uncharacterized membrane protein YhaH (DUF805 family)
MNYYFDVLQKYAVFSGRATRSEYWYFTLFNLLVSVILGLIGLLVSRAMGATPSAALLLFDLYALAVLLPGLGVSVRRLHDINFSGWWILLSLVPLGGLVLLVLYCLDSQPGENRFGPNPKGIEATTL